uniref:ATP-dependent DNA helicase n=1 Tax=Rhabditophanes sp. KR3021 TaxID=114890 RepID=A0AC35TIB5_9BILA
MLPFEVGPQSDDRVRNLPVDNEVAAIYYGNDTEEMTERKDIFVTSKDGKRKPIHHMYKLRDALTYPLLFPLGNPAYDSNTLFNLKRISRITYYQNLIAYRPQVFNPLHYAGLLFQQFLVDVFTTVETDRLNYIRQFELFKLDQNMRVNQDEEEFAKWVLNVGDGNEKYITNNKISIPQIIRSSGDLIKEVFEGQDQDSTDKWTSVILASTNKTVDTINETVLDKVIPGEVVHLLSADLLLSNPSVAEDIQNLPIEYLNSLAPSGMPVHDLRLKLNCIVMVLRNLNIKNGICNGTRLIVKGINSKFITCEHILNSRIGETVFIPRIILMSPEKEFPFTFSRK